jgi:hypothetical protein
MKSFFASFCSQKEVLALLREQIAKCMGRGIERAASPRQQPD